MFDFLGGIISAGANLLGSSMSNDAANDRAAQNIAMQREFAQNGIQWKVEDAKKAGINPIFALGASTNSFSNVVGGDGGGSGVAAAGQDISRALRSTQNQSDRMDGFTKAAQMLQLDKMSLENQLLKSQITRTNSAQSNPPMPIGQRFMIDGQGATAAGTPTPPGTSAPDALVVDQAMKRTPGNPGAQWGEPAAISDVGYSRTPTGVAVVPSKDVKERIEDNIIYEMQHFFRNNVIPSISMSAQESQTRGFPPAPPGKHWHYIPMKGEYQLVDTNEPWYSRLRRNWN